MNYKVVIGYTSDLVVFKIEENLYAVVTIDGDVQYHSNWIYLLRFVQLKKGEPDAVTLEKTCRFLSEDKTDINALGLVPLDVQFKEIQDSYEKELNLIRQKK